MTENYKTARQVPVRLIGEQGLVLAANAKRAALPVSTYLRRAALEYEPRSGVASELMPASELAVVDAVVHHGRVLKWAIDEEAPERSETYWDVWLQVPYVVGAPVESPTARAARAAECLRTILALQTHYRVLATRTAARLKSMTRYAPAKNAERYRRARRTLYVPLLQHEKTLLTAKAARFGVGLATYLRAIGLGEHLEPLDAAHEVERAAAIDGDLGRLGGLLKWWLTIDAWWCRLTGQDAVQFAIGWARPRIPLRNPPIVTYAAVYARAGGLLTEIETATGVLVRMVEAPARVEERAGP